MALLWTGGRRVVPQKESALRQELVEKVPSGFQGFKGT